MNKPLGHGVYRDSRTGNFYERPTIDGRRTWRKLPARTFKDAKILAAAHKTDYARSLAGVCRSPYAPPVATAGELIKAYTDAGCPDRHHRKRSGRQLDLETGRATTLLKFWRNLRADTLKPSDCHRFAAYRKNGMRKDRDGGRAIDLELTTLHNALTWAVSHGRLDTNPLAKRPRFRGRTVLHCRDAMPHDAEELHTLAAALFESRKSEALGWQLLLEAMTGCRTNEVLRLRWDAPPRKAGYMDDQYLWLERSKGGVNPFALLHPALRETIEALRMWRQWRRPKSPWFVPNYLDDGKEPASPQALTHALRRIGRIISGERRTSHGLRSYYVTVRRSQGVSDAQIAAEIGDATGAAIIASTYGAVPPNWQGGESIGWMPKEGKAWDVFEENLGLRAVCREDSKILLLDVSA